MTDCAIHFRRHRPVPDLVVCAEAKDSRRTKCPLYAVFIREKTRNPAKWDEYKKLVPASFQKHPVLFSPSLVVLKSSKAPMRGNYHSAEYQAACEHRF